MVPIRQERRTNNFQLIEPKRLWVVLGLNNQRLFKFRALQFYFRLATPKIQSHHWKAVGTLVVKVYTIILPLFVVTLPYPLYRRILINKNLPMEDESV